jgi:hypothetical protein
MEGGCMSDDWLMVLMVCAGVSLIVVVARVLNSWEVPPSLVGPERRIVYRNPTFEGELVQLECGHRVNLVVRPVQFLNCKECLGTANETDGFPKPSQDAK